MILKVEGPREIVRPLRARTVLLLAGAAGAALAAIAYAWQHPELFRGNESQTWRDRIQPVCDPNATPEENGERLDEVLTELNAQYGEVDQERLWETLAAYGRTCDGDDWEAQRRIREERMAPPVDDSAP